MIINVSGKIRIEKDQTLTQKYYHFSQSQWNPECVPISGLHKRGNENYGSHKTEDFLSSGENILFWKELFDENIEQFFLSATTVVEGECDAITHVTR